MHTKLSILIIIIFMVLIPTTIIAISSGKRTGAKVAHASESNAGSYSFVKTFGLEKDWNGLATKSSITKSPGMPLQEDGKYHHFHFQRLRRLRYRAIFKWAGKLLLVIVHLATLLCGYIHCLH